MFTGACPRHITKVMLRALLVIFMIKDEIRDIRSFGLRSTGASSK